MRFAQFDGIYASKCAVTNLCGVAYKPRRKNATGWNGAGGDAIYTESDYVNIYNSSVTAVTDCDGIRAEASEVDVNDSTLDITAKQTALYAKLGLNLRGKQTTVKLTVQESGTPRGNRQPEAGKQSGNYASR